MKSAPNMYVEFQTLQGPPANLDLAPRRRILEAMLTRRATDSVRNFCQVGETSVVSGRHQLMF